MTKHSEEELVEILKTLVHDIRIVGKDLAKMGYSFEYSSHAEEPYYLLVGLKKRVDI